MLVPILTAAPAGEPADGSGAAVWLLLLAGGFVWAIGYAISLRIHPFRACRRCGGSGTHKGTWFRGSFRACDRCGGAGREYRQFAHHPYQQNDHKRGGRR